MTEKELYTSPEVKVFNVRIEGVICTSTTGNTLGNGTLDDWTEGGSITF